jgi:hypothetical protein
VPYRLPGSVGRQATDAGWGVCPHELSHKLQSDEHVGIVMRRCSHQAATQASAYLPLPPPALWSWSPPPVTTDCEPLPAGARPFDGSTGCTAIGERSSLALSITGTVAANAMLVSAEDAYVALHLPAAQSFPAAFHEAALGPPVSTVESSENGSLQVVPSMPGVLPEQNEEPEGLPAPTVRTTEAAPACEKFCLTPLPQKRYTPD